MELQVELNKQKVLYIQGWSSRQVPMVKRNMELEGQLAGVRPALLRSGCLCFLAVVVCSIEHLEP